MLIFRIDDVSPNTNGNLLHGWTRLIRERFPCAGIIYGISVFAHDMSGEPGISAERVFPKILNAHSDHRLFYEVKKFGIHQAEKDVIIASHGLIHVDHRLLTRECQEMSILISCSLLGAKIFIPPFNKWNRHTEEICQEFGIQLIKFEDGWKHLKYNALSNSGKFYLHTHDFRVGEFELLMRK